MKDLTLILKESIELDLDESMSPTKLKIAAMKIVRDEFDYFKKLEIKKFVKELKDRIKGLPQDIAMDVFAQTVK